MREHGPKPWLTAHQRNGTRRQNCYSGISQSGPLPLLPQRSSCQAKGLCVSYRIGTASRTSSCCCLVLLREHTANLSDLVDRHISRQSFERDVFDLTGIGLLPSDDRGDHEMRDQEAGSRALARHIARLSRQVHQTKGPVRCDQASRANAQVDGYVDKKRVATQSHI